MKKNKLKSIIIVSVIIISFLIYHYEIRSIPASEVSALKLLYDNMGGKDWPEEQKQGWFEDGTISCDAHGIRCDDFKHVTYLSLSYLKGFIPKEINQLIYLDYLQLFINGVTRIPDEIGDLTDLESMYIASDNILGGVPKTIGKLKDLKSLFVVGYQKFYTKESLYFFSSTLVENDYQMNATVNGFPVQGKIPKEIGQLNNLKKLNLSGINFYGEIPKEIGQLKKIMFLSITGTAVEGRIPSVLGSLDFDYHRNFTILNENIIRSVAYEIEDLVNLYSTIRK